MYKDKLSNLRQKFKELDSNITVNISSSLDEEDLFISIPSIYTNDVNELKKQRDNLSIIIKEIENEGV